MTQPSPRERAFAEHLAGLAAREDSDARAALAALRRGLGKEPGEVAEVARVVLRLMHEGEARPEVSERAEAAYFQVAALFASHRGSWGSRDHQWHTNLGASFRRLAGPPGGPDEAGPERRFVALLNAHPGELDRHLRHAVSLLNAHDVPIDWAQLLRDLQEWTYEARPVQLAWARAFWGSRSDAGETTAVPVQPEGDPAGAAAS